MYLDCHLVKIRAFKYYNSDYQLKNLFKLLKSLLVTELTPHRPE